MVDNFALLVSQLMMIVVLWRCYTLPDEGEPEQPKAFGRKTRRKPAASEKTRKS